MAHQGQQGAGSQATDRSSHAEARDDGARSSLGFFEEEPVVELQIVNPDPKYRAVSLIEPTTLGYVHVAAEVRPRSLPFGARARGRGKSELVGGLKQIARELERLDAVETATIFDALASPPATRFSPYLKEREQAIHVARFDVVVLIETASPEVVRDVQGTRPYQDLLELVRNEAKHTHVIAARNAKRVGDVDKTRQGLFLFNYFVADDARVALELWDYLAGWYQVETGLDNSTLLVPLEGERSDYLAINNARTDEGLPRFIARQMSKKTFRTYVQANLEANRVGAMAILYRLA
jgi:hypothetical protein